jgi:hypothetical protein
MKSKINIKLILKQLDSIKIENEFTFYPCKLILDNCEIDNSYLVKRSDYLTLFGVTKPDEKYFNLIPFNELKDIKKSQSCLPANLANKMYSIGETRMGGYRLKLLFNDNSYQIYETGTLIDFLEMPKNKSVKEIIDILPNKDFDEDFIENKIKINLCFFE